MNKQIVNPVYVVVLLICIATGLMLMLVKERNKEQMLVEQNDLMLKKCLITGRQTKILNKKINEIRANKSDTVKKPAHKCAGFFK